VASHPPGRFVVMKRFRFSVFLKVGFASKEPTTAAENWVITDVTQMVSQIIDAVQSAAAIPASKGRDHFTGEWVG